jgi:diguanylate cyclase (GGDEF)-like protein
MKNRAIPVEFEELKSSGTLPSPTGVGIKILEITRTDEFSADDMGQAIMSDSSLTGRILELANSADRAGQEPITTVSAAIMRLGATTVRNLALAFSVISERDDGACKAFNYPLYWSGSLARAVAAKALSVHVGGVSSEEAYVAGLLAEVGVLALATVHSEPYAKVLLETRGQPMSAVLAAEIAAFDIDHSTVGYCMMLDWGLPDSFASAVESFNLERLSPGENVTLDTLSDLLRFADAISSAMLLTATTPPRRINEVGEQIERLQVVLGYSDADVARVVSKIAGEWSRWGERLDIATCDVSFESIKEGIRRGREAFKKELTLRNGGGIRCESVVADKIVTNDDLVEDARGLGAEKIKVLAVDDDSVALRLLVTVLRKQGFDVSFAKNGAEAMRISMREGPDLIVADHEMPEMSGLELTRALRRSKRGASMYIVLLTGAREEDLLVEAFEAGVDDYVQKPFDTRHLRARLRAGMRIVGLQRRIEEDRRTILRQLAEKNNFNRKLKMLSLTDLLTEVPNRRHAMERVESEWKSAVRTGSPFAVLMVDIDRFKAVNDTYGHDVGDVVLKETAQAISGTLRGEDQVARLGGEEFLVIARGANADDAAVLGERIRLVVEENVVEAEGYRDCVTISVGVASFDQGYMGISEMMKAADDAVYQSKTLGRNQVRSAREEILEAEGDGARRKSA